MPAIVCQWDGKQYAVGSRQYAVERGLDPRLYQSKLVRLYPVYCIAAVAL